MSMELLVCWLTGIIVGLIVTTTIVGVKSAIGTLRIDSSNEEKDIYRLDIHDLEKVPNKKYIILRVDKNANLSQQ